MTTAPVWVHFGRDMTMTDMAVCLALVVTGEVLSTLTYYVICLRETVLDNSLHGTSKTRVV